MAGLHHKAQQTLTMQLGDLETRSTIFDAVPQDTADQAVDIRRQARRTVHSADREFTNAGSQQPQKAGYMIHMGVRDEHIGDLVRDPRRQTCALAEIEQQAAPPVAQAHV